MGKLYQLTDKNKDTWCVNAFHSLCGMNNGSTKICCMYEMDMPLNTYPTLGDAPLNDHMVFKEFMEVREDLSNGIKHKACRKCWEEEDSGRDSKRVRDNKVYFDSDIRFRPGTLAKIELSLGNTCNIKCRTCAPHSSSTWMREFQETRYPDMDYKTWVVVAELDKFYKHYGDESPFWDDIEKNLSTIKQFDFYGGEPFMSKKMWSLINAASEKGYANDIELHYNTNGTLWPEKELECWKNFRHVSLSFSIDGINDRFEFMRHPAKWDTVIESYRKAEKMKDEFGNMSLDWCITLSNLNIYYLPETLEYFYNNVSPSTGLYLNLVHGPKYFNIQYLHDDLKDVVRERLSKLKQNSLVTDNAASQIDGIINFMNNGKFDKITWDNFKKNIDTHDTYRKENYYETFPEFGELIKAK